MIRWPPTLSMLLALVCFAAIGAPTNSDVIPPLRPPLEKVPPAFWEAHGIQAIAAGLGGLLILTVACLLVFRRKKPEAPPPEVLARAQIEAMRRSDPSDLSGISRVLRNCLSQLYGLPSGEMTTAEFCRALEEAETKQAFELGNSEGQPRDPKTNSAGAAIAAKTCAFLRRCDTEKFAPNASSQPWDAATEALELIDAAANRKRSTAPGEAKA